MTTIETICQFLEKFAPPRLAESWDNVGLLVGDRRREVRRVMTCLTITPSTAAEAIEGRAELIVTHHPLPFHALKRLTADTTAGRLLLELIAAADGRLQSAHGVRLGGRGDQSAVGRRAGAARHPAAGAAGGGPGRGTLRLAGRADGVGRAGPAARGVSCAIERMQMVGGPSSRSAWWRWRAGRRASFSTPARHAGCDAMVSARPGSTPAWRPRRWGVGLLLPGHFASERLPSRRWPSRLGPAVPRGRSLGQPSGTRSAAAGCPRRREGNCKLSQLQVVNGKLRVRRPCSICNFHVAIPVV